jgi:hypothetical protein
VGVWFPSLLTLLLMGAAPQGTNPVHVGQWARTFDGHKWVAGVVQTGIAGTSAYPKCLALNLDDSGLPYSVWLHASDSLEVWVPIPGMPKAPGGTPNTGRWVGVGRGDRSRQLCT